MKTVIVLAILAAASTGALAKDFKQKANAPTVAATQMTDGEMDRVTGGGFGLTTAEANGASPPAANFLLPPGNTPLGPGYGQSTAVSTGNYPFH
jgi:hypothetical protein